MIFEALFIALPFLLGLWVSAQRGLRAFGTWVVVETLLCWLAVVALRQPLVAAGVTTLLLGTTGFAGGLLLARKRRLQAGAVPGLAFLAGVVITGTIAGALQAPVRNEVVRTAKWVETDQELAYKKLIETGAQAYERMTWALEDGRMFSKGEPFTRLQLEAEKSELTRPLVRFTGADFYLTPQDTKTYVVRATNYESRLAPWWMWGPIERRMVADEHRESLEGLQGRFVSIEDDGVHVLLTVQTNPSTRVTIVPPMGSDRPRLILGFSPMFQRSGAQVGDTVLLEDPETGVNTREVIEYGYPGELKVITKNFGAGRRP